MIGEPQRSFTRTGSRARLRGARTSRVRRPDAVDGLVVSVRERADSPGRGLGGSSLQRPSSGSRRTEGKGLGKSRRRPALCFAPRSGGRTGRQDRRGTGFLPAHLSLTECMGMGQRQTPQLKPAVLDARLTGRESWRMSCPRSPYPHDSTVTHAGVDEPPVAFAVVFAKAPDFARGSDCRIRMCKNQAARVEYTSSQGELSRPASRARRRAGGWSQNKWFQQVVEPLSWTGPR